MQESEQRHTIYTKPKDSEFNTEPPVIHHRTEVLGNMALNLTKRTRLDALAEDREKIIDGRPETD